MVSRTRVLVVDDEPGIGKILSIKLRLHGFEVMTTTSGAAAVDLVRAQEPDVILLDVVMPGLTGIDVLDRVRSFSQVPVIMLTARPEFSQLASARGADDFISKPFDPDRVVEKIRLALGQGG